MARRRRGENEIPGDAPAEVPAGDGQPQIEVRMRGGADDVKRQLGVATEEKPAALPQTPDDDKRKFVEALRNSRYIIRVKRLTPRKFQDVQTNVEVWQGELPLGYQEIQEEVSKECGGGKYRVGVIDPASNATIVADTFEVPGNPIIPEMEMSQEEQDRIFLAGRPKSTTELNTESLERRAQLLTKQAEVESIEAELEAARERRKQSKAPVQDDTRIADLDRRLTEARHQADLEARDRKHAEEMRDLKALIAQNAKPAKENDSVTILLEQMRADRKASDDRFTAMMKQMQDDKMTALLEEVKAIKNKPQSQGTSLLEQAEAMLKMKKIFGWGGEDEDDDGDDADDDRPWWEKALDKLGGKFGDKLLAKFTDMEEKGQTVDREAFIKEMSGYADQVAAEAVARQQQPLPAPAKPHALPPPPAQLPPPPPPAATAPNPVTQLPPPPPPAAQQLPPAPPQQSLTLEQEIMIRVAGTLEILAREMVLRPNEYHWNYEGCWTSLPEEILEKVCAAPDAPGLIDALTIPGVDPAKAAELKEKIVANPRMAAWISRGLDELKLWWAEKQKDPSYDPFEDEGDDAEGEVTE